MGRVNVETSKAVGGKQKVSDRMKYQEGNGFLNDRRLESFGHLLDDYVLNGAMLTIDPIDNKKIHISEGVISFKDQLWRAFISDFIVYEPNTTYYLGYLIDKGYVFGVTEPAENYMRLWSVITDVNAAPGSSTDFRGELNRVKFKAIYDGVYLNTEEVDAAVASVVGAVADAETAVNTAKQAVIDAETAVTNTKVVISNAEKATTDAINVTDSTLLAKKATETATQDAIIANSATVESTKQSEITRAAMKLVIDNFKTASQFVLSTQYKRLNIVRNNGSSYIAKLDTLNNPLPISPIEENMWWVLLSKKGDKGDKGTGVTILGSFSSEAELPITGDLGDAYLIDGVDDLGNTVKNLHIWDGSTWENVGNIQGPKGEPGKDGDGVGTVTSINGTLPDETGNVTLVIPEQDTSLLATKEELNAHASDSTEQKHICVGEVEPLTHNNGGIWFQTGLGESDWDGGGGIAIRNAVLSDGPPGDTTVLWLDY